MKVTMVLLKKLKRLHLAQMKIKECNSVETYAYGTSKDLVSEKQEIKCNNIKNYTKKDELW